MPTRHYADPPPRQSPLVELTAVFLKLGTIGFGGPAAHIAFMEDEVVRRRRWLTSPEFLDLLGATNLIPGPNSTELAIHIGRQRAGIAGLVVAGTAFIVPATMIVTAIAWGYRRYGAMPQTEALPYGIKPVVIAIIAQALVALGRTALKSVPLAFVGLCALVATVVFDVHEIIVLGAAGGGAALVAWGVQRRRSASARFAVPILASPTTRVAAALAGSATLVPPVTLWSLFLVFAKAGSLLFGSGYVLLAFLRADLVDRLRWLSDEQLIDAIAVGQVTPGPVFTTATFIGYILAGLPGAAVATVAIFLPAFVFVALSAPFVPGMRRSRVIGAILDAVNVSSLALMAAVTGQLARSSVSDLPTAGLAAASAVLLFRFHVNPAWLILGGALLGLVFR